MNMGRKSEIVTVQWTYTENMNMAYIHTKFEVYFTNIIAINTNREIVYMAAK